MARLMHKRDLLRQLIPPVLWRLASAVRLRLAGRQRGPFGTERDASFYDESFRSAGHWKSHYTESRYYSLWSVLADRVQRDGVSVLDIGCGPGQLALLLRDKGIAHYTGLDFSRERILQARRTCPEFTFVEGDVFESKLLEQSDYDTVVCTEFLEHIVRDLDVLARIRKGSRFHATVPNFSGLAHVRAFQDVSEVIARYGRYFDHFTVDAHLANNQGKTYFLMHGIRNATAPEHQVG